MSYSKMTTAKMFCKVCQDAGKSEKEYTAHCLRSRNRNGTFVVTCPLLLQTECRFCYTKGHTTKYCPAIAAKNNERYGRAHEQKKTSAKEPIKIPTTNKKVFHGFSALANLDSGDEDYFSALANLDSGDKDESLIQAKPAPKTHPSWADIATVATKPAIVPQAVDPYENYTLLTQTVVHKRRYEEDPSPKSIPIPTRKVHCNWADAESSESDDDDNAPDNECTY